jgi:hypothetical protein
MPPGRERRVDVLHLEEEAHEPRATEIRALKQLREESAKLEGLVALLRSIGTSLADII